MVRGDGAWLGSVATGTACAVWDCAGAGDFAACLAECDAFGLARDVDVDGDGEAECDGECEAEGAAEEVFGAGAVGVWVTGGGALPAPYM